MTHHQALVIFFRQFSTLIQAGIPLHQSFAILEKCQANQPLRLLIHTVQRDLLTGKNLSTALQKHPLYFDQLTCQLILIGEQTGKLDTLLLTIADFQEKKWLFKKKYQQALFYPALITLSAGLITLAMLLFVIPRFNELFENAYETLPLLTRCIFSLSAFVRHSLGYFIMTLILLILCLRQQKLTQPLLHFFHQKLCALKPIEHFLNQVALARLSRQLSLTLTAGIPLLNALSLTLPLGNTPTLRRLIHKLRQSINAGIPFHHALSAFPTLSPLMTQLVKIGEESGTLEHMLEKTAEILDADIDQRLHQFTKLLEPLIMLTLGVLIGGLVIGMYLPIFKLGSVL